MIFGISGTKRTVRNREVSVLWGARKERLDCTSGSIHVNLYLDFSRAYSPKVIDLLKEEKFGLWRNNIPSRKVKVNS